MASPKNPGRNFVPLAYGPFFVFHRLVCRCPIDGSVLKTVICQMELKFTPIYGVFVGGSPFKTEDRRAARRLHRGQFAI